MPHKSFGILGKGEKEARMIPDACLEVIEEHDTGQKPTGA